ncbi:MAG: ATP-grasp domain-containing protein [Bacteroidia bacterium]|nr:ATP-grasp domain-containing protein [Bacteroidia bacterium]MDW8416332.1 biotin carboxylase N-terminal domain-containing protein [Bacteroidia bacterium]
MSVTIERLLIANRGEIARRIIKTCRKMGIATIAVYSDADRFMPFVREADEAYALSGSTSAETYLHIDKILEIADRAEADAIHPGYGFLSENAAFARAIAEKSAARQREGKKPLIFVGPHPDAIEQMGSKSNAKLLVSSYGVPTIPGFQCRGAQIDEIIQAAREIGFPVLLKAAGGGGGKGMRIVYEASELPAAYESAQREAQSAFGDSEIILEKYFPSARHIEFQILGDKHGHIVHLYERECSIQRRYQKVIEESPSPVLSEAERQAMGQAAVQAARAIQYDNAGTVEFIRTAPGEFYFLEVNTRLQVEHPVTEAITGLDLVEWQIRIAAGEPFPYRQEDIPRTGYAIEARLYAEDPKVDFRPSTGRILYWQVPDLPYLRVDSGIETGSTISPFYDPMIAKIIVHAPSREMGIKRLGYALGQLACVGLAHNQPFLRALCGDPEFIRGAYDTRFLERRTDLLSADYIGDHTLIAWATGLTIWRMVRATVERPYLPTLLPNWRNTPQAPLPYGWKIKDKIFTVECRALHNQHFSCKIAENQEEVRLLSHTAQRVIYEWRRQRVVLDIFPSDTDEGLYWIYQSFVGSAEAKALPRFPDIADSQQRGTYTAPMPGQITKIYVQPGEHVDAGQPLLVFVSMKMENLIEATEPGRVEAIFVKEGDTVEAGVQLLQIQSAK